MSHLHIREATSEDKFEILNLLNDVFNNVQRSEFKRGESFWRWKFEDNVFGKSILTVAVLDNKIVGFNNLWSWKFRYRGQVFTAFQPCDSVVDKRFQKFGIFSKMRLDGLQRALDIKNDLIFNFPNKNSLPVYLNLGWNNLGSPNWRVCIINPVNLIISKLIKGKSRPVPMPEKYKLDIELLYRLSDNNLLFDKFISNNHVTGYFEWRYKDHPSLDYGVVCWGEGHKSIAAIFNLKDNGKSREMVVVEFVGNFSSFDKLIIELKKTAKELKADFFAFMDFGSIESKSLILKGVFKFRNKNFTVLPLNTSLETHVSVLKNWNLMAAMHDSI